VFRTLLAMAIVGTAVLSILATFGAFSNEDGYGRVDIPGHKVLHFPAGEVDIAFDTTVNDSGQRAGDYHVSAHGRAEEYVSPQLMFGTETSVASVALPGGLVIAAMLLASLFAGSIAKRSGDGRRR
jgi:hypothetical protein